MIDQTGAIRLVEALKRCAWQNTGVQNTAYEDATHRASGRDTPGWG
jgi:hypothetical protein